MTRKIAPFICLMTCAALLAGCALYKPIRVMTPQAFGMTCPTDDLCLEDVDRLAEATKLRRDAAAFVQTHLGPFRTPPRVLFCSTTACFSNFGNPDVRGLNVATFGAVINAHGWNPYILRHELIHHWQNENFGVLETSVLLPRWFVEGMAYDLSGDLRTPLLHAPSESHRQQFRDWIARGHDWRVPPT